MPTRKKEHDKTLKITVHEPFDKTFSSTLSRVNVDVLFLKSRGERLATSKETVSDPQRLTYAYKGKYSLGVDSKDLPRQAGWYQIVRDNNEVSYKPIKNQEEFERLKDMDGYKNLLHMALDKIDCIEKAIKEGSAVALCIKGGPFSGSFLEVDASPEATGVRRVIVKEVFNIKEEKAKMERLEEIDKISKPQNLGAIKSARQLLEEIKKKSVINIEEKRKSLKERAKGHDDDTIA